MGRDGTGTTLVARVGTGTTRGRIGTGTTLWTVDWDRHDHLVRHGRVGCPEGEVPARARPGDRCEPGTGANPGQVRTRDRCEPGTGATRGLVRTGDRRPPGTGATRESTTRDRHNPGRGAAAVARGELSHAAHLQSRSVGCRPSLPRPRYRRSGIRGVRCRRVESDPASSRCVRSIRSVPRRRRPVLVRARRRLVRDGKTRRFHIMRVHDAIEGVHPPRTSPTRSASRIRWSAISLTHPVGASTICVARL
jgi:hypothetical protein